MNQIAKFNVLNVMAFLKTKENLMSTKKYSIKFQPVPFVINNLQKKGLDKQMKTVHNSKISNKTVSMY